MSIEKNNAVKERNVKSGKSTMDKKTAGAHQKRKNVKDDLKDIVFGLEKKQLLGCLSRRKSSDECMVVGFNGGVRTKEDAISRLRFLIGLLKTEGLPTSDFTSWSFDIISDKNGNPIRTARVEDEE